ncbi:MAG: hypothetical protein QOC56_2564 [Alphaproteobacteria bacterium]|nr:hypothetical protein [Alphaproteobacteria bacterium]
MSATKTNDAVAGMVQQAQTPRPAGRLLRGIGWSTIALGVGLPALLAFGFLWFLWRLPGEEAALERRADGIVVLTGGASRISDAIELLATGHGRRLLISGANRATTAEEISRLNPDFARWVRCCVDVDRSLNTLGNAIETRLWAERRGFHSLIVVTSSYHMPRAMAEIKNQLPGAVLFAFPVISDRIRTEPWWASVATTKLVFSEYLKYIVAQVRIRLNPATGARLAG